MILTTLSITTMTSSKSINNDAESLHDQINVDVEQSTPNNTLPENFVADDDEIPSPIIVDAENAENNVSCCICHFIPSSNYANLQCQHLAHLSCFAQQTFNIDCPSCSQPTPMQISQRRFHKHPTHSATTTLDEALNVNHNMKRQNVTSTATPRRGC